MHRQRLKLMAAAALAALSTHPAAAQSAEPKTAEQVYKNITELKGTPADQLGPAMSFIASSLGVNCEFCHVQGKPEADDKPAKRTARQMMAMQAAINKESFRGQRQITCFSCHRGSVRPVNMPPVQESDAMPRPASPAPAAGGAPQITPDQILEKYVTAAGGAENLKKITTRVMKGAILVGSNEAPIEIYTKAPNMRLSVSHMNGRESYTAFDGRHGWMGNGAAAHEMSPAEAASAALDAQFALPLSIKEVLPQIRRGRPEEVSGVMCNVINGMAPGGIAVRLYFDANTGLLVRMLRSTDTPVGRLPVQVDYADYREQDGVKIPFRWTLARVNGRFTIQVKEVQDNVPIDDAKFAMPAAK